MSTFYLPFRGEIVSLAARGRRLLLAVKHTEGHPLSALQIDIEALLVMGAQMDALSPIGPDDAVHCVAADGERVYFGSPNGNIRCEADGKLVDLNELDAAPVKLAVLKDGQLLAQLPRAIVILSGESGAILQRFDFPDNDITALAVEDSGQRFALGFDNGTITLYFERDGEYHEGYLLDESDEILEIAHERGVTSLLFVEDEDRQSQLISGGNDLGMLQAPIAEARPMPRETKEMHSQPIRDLVSGFDMRFYSLGADKSVKTWTNNYNRRRPATWSLNGIPSVGLVIALPSQNAQGR